MLMAYNPRSTTVANYKKLTKSAKRKAQRISREYGIKTQFLEPLRTLESFTSRQEFEKYTRQLTRFTKDPAGQYKYKKLATGTVIPYKEYLEVKREQKRINKKLAETLKKKQEKEALERGKPTGQKVGQTLALANKKRWAMLQPWRVGIDDIKNVDLLKKYLEKISRYKGNFQLARDRNYKKNYITALYNELGTDDRVKKIVNKINRMSLETFIDIYDREPDAHIDFIYESMKRNLKLKTLEEIFNVA